MEAGCLGARTSEGGRHLAGGEASHRQDREGVSELWEQTASSGERNLGLAVRSHHPGFDLLATSSE